MTTDQLTQAAPEIRVLHHPTGWTLAFLSPEPQNCATNHNGDRPADAPCTATAVWKVVELYDMHATFSFWCDTDLPAEYRPTA